MTRILLVEDDQVQRQVLDAVLDQAMGKGDYSVEHADRLSRALVLLRERPFDLVLLDLGLSDSEGFETLRTMRSEAPDAAIIVLTGEDDEEMGTRAVREGAQDFLTKGKVPAETLGRCIRYAMERHHRVQELRGLALLDELTGLLNRRGFMALAWHQLKVATRTKRPTTMLFFDVDGMKKINDTLGHNHGDAALLHVAEVLRSELRESDIVGRVGGDEFCALLVDVQNDADPLSRVRSRLEKLSTGDGMHEAFSVSIGAVRYDPDEPCSVGELIERADQSMYRHKRRNDDRSTSVTGGTALRLSKS